MPIGERMTRWVWMVMLVIWTGCAKHNDLFCKIDSDCVGNPDLNFCDVDGDYEASGHIANTCIPKPSDCAVERCGCTAGLALSCKGDELTVCAPDGVSTLTSTCALGCGSATACARFEPSNGLGAALADAANEPNVVLPSGVTIDADTGGMGAGGAP